VALLQRPQPFNIVSALGLSRQELRHSDLLAYLLDSRHPHGIGDLFVRALLRRVVPLLSENMDVGALRLDSVTVQREWNFIDILIESPSDRLAIIIENKVDTSEHSDQLGRYHRLVQKHRPGWQIVGIYLTLDGTLPSSAADRAHYAAVGYGDIAVMLTELAADSRIDGDVQTLLRHYANQIRSDLVREPDSDTASLARALYMDHRQAFDTMIRARDARTDMIQRFFNNLFASTQRAQPSDLQLDKFFFNRDLTRSQTRFAPKEWYRRDLEVSTSWTRSGLILIFEFLQAPQQIHMTLTVGPAPGAESLRRALYDLAVRQIAPLYPAWSNPDGEWFNIYVRDIFPYGSDYFTTASDDTIRTTIRCHWEDFIQRDLPVIRATIRHEILGKTWDNA
jgi:hypothetical protein